MLSYSDDFFKTEKVLKIGAARFAVTDFYLFITYLDSPTSRSLRIRMADLDTIEKLKDITLNVDLQVDQAYTILDSNSRHVVLQITKPSSFIQYGTIFVSDSRGNHFDPVLDFNVKNDFGFCDFDRIKGLSNVIIANHYDEDSFRLARFHQSTMAPSADSLPAIKRLLTKVTKISFTRGQSWVPLGPVRSTSE